MPLSLFIDILMTFLLAGTIYFVWRLSGQIERFRSTRADMDRLIRDLNAAVEKAQQAIAGMKATAQGSGEDLARIMRSATELSDELQIMTESGNNLAKRLEAAASRGGNTGATSDIGEYETSRTSSPASAPASPGFSIRDPEFDGASLHHDDPFDSEDEHRSEAERELIKAMQQNRKTPI